MAKIEDEEYNTISQKLFPHTMDFLEDHPFRYIGRWLRTLSLSTLLAYTGCNIACNDYTYSNGVRVGVINKFSKKGTFWKTYEGQMALEGIVSGNNIVGANVWDFSRDNQSRKREDIEKLAEQIQQYAESSTKVKIKYHEPWTTWPWRSSTNYHVQRVESVNK